MGAPTKRDRGELREGVTRWLRAGADPVPGADRRAAAALEVRAVAHAEAGMANETVVVELGPAHPGIVLRLPPVHPMFPTYDLARQARVQNEVAAAGIPAPAPAVFVPDPQWIGTPFLVMPRVDGLIPGPAPVFDAAVTGAPRERQRHFVDGLIDMLAQLHAVDWAAHGLGGVVPGPAVEDALDHWAAYVAWAGEGDPLPVLTEGLAWCADHRPPDDHEPAVLLWGDARLGNLVFDDRGDVHAVLDWDLATLGPADMDLGWYFGLEFMMERLFGRRVAGFPERAVAVARYEERSGRTVANLDWHEVFALVRALAINDRSLRIAAAQRPRSGDRDVPGVGHRTENPMIAVLTSRIEAG
ncbi:MAG: phosphotransferase family protein [Acidimicrobiales bacterium]